MGKQIGPAQIEIQPETAWSSGWYKRHFWKNAPFWAPAVGIQILNAFLGGSLIQDLGTAHSMVDGDYRLHTVCTKAGSQLAALYGERAVVNSGHHQAIRRVAPGFTATQWTCDGVIEAIEHTFLPVLGVQWHPERMCEAHQSEITADGSLLFDRFIACCRRRGRY